LTVEAYAPKPGVVAPRSSITNPFRKEQGLDINLPDFDQLFSKIQQVSPLAASVIQANSGEIDQNNVADGKGSSLKWKKVETRPEGPYRSIEKVENFEGKQAPLLRFQSTFKGPCVGEKFGQYIVDMQERVKWDSQVDTVKELYPINDLDAANFMLGCGKKYGDCSRLGIGYGKTKPGIVTPREQLFVYGQQTFADGSCILWGQEMSEKHNHLFPNGGPVHTRAKSHLFSATLKPTSPEEFDVEYVVQLEVGGGIPQFLTTPVIIDTVKNLFRIAQAEFADVTSHIYSYVREKALGDRESILYP